MNKLSDFILEKLKIGINTKISSSSKLFELLDTLKNKGKNQILI